MARSVADRLADAGFTTSAPPAGAQPPATGTHVLVTAFAAAEPSPAIYDETRRVIAAMAPGGWWLDMTHYPRTGDEPWGLLQDLARVRRIRVPVLDVRGVLVASPPTVLDLRSREVCDAILAIADLVLPTQRPEIPIASLELGLAEPPSRPHHLQSLPAPARRTRPPAAAGQACSKKRPGLRLA
ncbi:hypothetical protein BOQ63_000290 (plasmid) [Streptomyces viridifaciens]|nr:hypothetical protein BOQ63_000290 [Streptomyces viridifaciens]